MYKWIIRVSAATVGTVLLVMIKSLNFNPILYIFPIMMILLAFLNCAEDIAEEQPIADDVRKVVIKPDNRRWDFSEEECSRTISNKAENKRNIKLVL